MSFRLEMLQTARLAPKLLGESSGLVAEFLERQSLDRGQFGNRDGQADLYYTVFGLEAWMALGITPPWEKLTPWLADQGEGEGLDFIHLCCMARCLAAVPDKSLVAERAAGLASRILAFGTADGGFNQRAGAASASAYGSLLGYGALADLKMPTPPGARVGFLDKLRSPAGGMANEPGLALGSTTASAAAVALGRHLRQPMDEALGGWILAQASPEGGFLAFPHAPIPDLLSTAVAIHALDAMQISYAHVKEMCLDFIDSLWSAEGGFHGNWTDDVLDVEYTYYGLLALGHLSL